MSSYKITDKQLNTIWTLKDTELPIKYFELNIKRVKDNIEKELKRRIVSYNRSIYIQNHYEDYGFESNRCPWFMYRHTYYTYSPRTYELWINYGDTFDKIDNDNKFYSTNKSYGGCSILTDLVYLLNKTNTNYEIIESPCDKSKYIVRLYNKSDYRNIKIAQYNNEVELEKNDNDIVQAILYLYSWLIENFNELKI